MLKNSYLSISYSVKSWWKNIDDENFILKDKREVTDI